MGNEISKKSRTSTGDLIRPIAADKRKSDQIEKSSANPVPLGEYRKVHVSLRAHSHRAKENQSENDQD